ncbi:HPP family protein [Pseudoroseomonas wenyumeiae]
MVTGLACTWLAGSAGLPPVLIAPLGASAVLLFAVPASPLTQPWSILGGNTVSALAGVTCAHWIAEPLLAAPLAAALAIGAMFTLRCLHPPGGAIALTTVLGGPAVTAAGYHFAFSPVALNSLVLMFAALVYNNATRRAYPHRQQAAPRHPHQTADLQPTERLGLQAGTSMPPCGSMTRSSMSAARTSRTSCSRRSCMPIAAASARSPAPISCRAMW